MAKGNNQEPWDRSNPRKTASKAKGSRRLTPAQKAEARGRARKAGRKYPNLVDNMAVARKKSSGGAKKKSGGAKKKSSKKRTAKGRAAVRRSTKPRPAARKRR